MDGRTDGRADEQTASARSKRIEWWSEEKTVGSETSKRALVSCNYGASATPALSPIIRVRFEVRFSGPLGGPGPAREPPRGIATQRLHKPRRYEARKEEEEEEEQEIRRDREKKRETVEHTAAIHYVASAVRHGSISPFWRGLWSAYLFLRPQRLHDWSHAWRQLSQKIPRCMIL